MRKQCRIQLPSASTRPAWETTAYAPDHPTSRRDRGIVAVEQRVSRLEGAYEQVDRRLDGIERTLEALRSDTNSRFNTLYIITAALWVSTVGLLIGLYFR